jgi:hypothetical protein
MFQLKVKNHGQTGCMSFDIVKSKVGSLHAMEALWLRGGLAPTLS